ncbi:MAG TPA: hypothetical protein VMH80_00855 [Bryobacteraceae bacterium]|nr:hypothetical protein [Bryobacteraceae bacterium]
MPTAEALSHLVDDATVVYILENRRYFEDLRQIASQLAGLLVLAAAGSKESTSDHPMLTAAFQLHRDATDGLRRARPTLRARRHHEHVLEAASHLADALAAAERRLADVDPILIPLRAGYAALRQAANALPGFEIISFERACCGIHLPNEVKPA